MAPSDPREKLARRAYERGRARLALRGAAVVLPMTVTSLACCNRPAVSLALGACLFAVTALALFRGSLQGRAAGAGLLAGTVPLLLPLAVRWSGHGCCADGCDGTWVGACLGAGLLAGALVGAAARRERRPVPFLLVAGSLAAVAGAMGCVPAGVGGVIAMMGAMLVASAPQAMWAPARRPG